MKLSEDKLELVEKFKCGVGRSFANGWCDSHGIIAGLRALKTGETKKCRFIVANREATYHVYEVTVTYERGTAANSWDARFRQLDNGSDECGLGSGKDTGLAAVALAAKLYQVAGAKSACIVGQPNLEIFRDTTEIER